MKSNWPLTTLAAIQAPDSKAIGIGPFGSKMKSDCYVQSGIPVIRGTNISDIREFSGDFVYITPSKAKELASSTVRKGDIVFPHRGSIGEVGIVTGKKHQEYVLSSSLMKLTCDTAIADPVYVYFFFKSNTGKTEILRFSSTVGTPGIGQPLTSLKSMRLPLPPLKTQKAIAHILGTLDDKINLNRRMNETLEAMARALFKSWFVDFDPVKAKMEGRHPAGMDAATAALFPDRLKETPLGNIPMGWEIGPLKQIATLCTDSVHPYSEPMTLWEHYSIPAFDKNMSPAIEKGESIKSIKYRVPYNSILLSKLNPQFQRVWMTNAISNKRAICSTEFMPFISHNDSTSFIYELMKSEAFQNTLLNSVTGTTGSRQRVIPSQIKQLKIIIPSPVIIKKFCEYTKDMHTKAIVSISNATTLCTLRDTLLPKLVSGELSVVEAEKKLGDEL